MVKKAGRGMSGLILVATLALVLLGAGETEPTRAEYVTHLETICRPRSEESERALNGVRADLRAERLNVAARKFASAQKIFGSSVTETAAVPRPPADAATLTKWFSYLHEEERYLGKIAAALRAGQADRSARFTARFVHNGNLANNVVLAFGFNYCAFRASRFG